MENVDNWPPITQEGPDAIPPRNAHGPPGPPPAPAGAMPRQPGPRALTDERPTPVGVRVCLAGDVRDGPAGWVESVAGVVRWVRFDGEAEPIACDLAELRRLP